MKKSRILWIGLFAMLIYPLAAFAKYDYHFDQKISPYGQYESEASQKLSRGLTNIFYGWTEMMQTPIHMADEPRESLWRAGVIGVPYGFGRFLTRTGAGIFETFTFFIPQKPMMAPIEGTQT